MQDRIDRKEKGEQKVKIVWFIKTAAYKNRRLSLTHLLVRQWTIPINIESLVANKKL